MQRKLFLILSLFGLILTACSSNQIYVVQKVKNTEFDYRDISPESDWKQADVLTNFSHPWRIDNPPETQFRALWDDEYFYFMYKVADHNILLYVTDNRESDLMKSDRVELDLLSEKKMDLYYCFEMDPTGRVLDYTARYHREFEFEWDSPPGVFELVTEADSLAYTVAGRLSLNWLRKIKCLEDQELKAGLFRANVVELEGDSATFQWISWLRPDSVEPDFHIPSGFGTLILKENK